MVLTIFYSYKYVPRSMILMLHFMLDMCCSFYFFIFPSFCLILSFKSQWWFRTAETLEFSYAVPVRSGLFRTTFAVKAEDDSVVRTWSFRQYYCMLYIQACSDKLLRIRVG